MASLFPVLLPRRDPAALESFDCVEFKAERFAAFFGASEAWVPAEQLDAAGQRTAAERCNCFCDHVRAHVRLDPLDEFFAHAKIAACGFQCIESPLKIGEGFCLGDLFTCREAEEPAQAARRRPEFRFPDHQFRQLLKLFEAEIRQAQKVKCVQFVRLHSLVG